MPEVTEVRCDDNSLSLLLAPGTNPDRVAAEFEVGAVVSVGAEWACRPDENGGPSSSVTRRVATVDVNGSHIDLGTIDCDPLEAFERLAIDMYSGPDVAPEHRRAAAGGRGPENAASTSVRSWNAVDEAL